MELELKNISKQWSKDKSGVKGLSMTINKGVLGLLGPNGAGKSTLMKMITTMYKPTLGSILFDGIDITKKPNSIRQVLGYLPQDFGIYPNLNAFEFLEYMAAIKGIGGSNLKNRIHDLIASVNLIEVAKAPVGSYSGGMKQRLGIAQALLNNPRVLILDEPTVGLDPEERVRFRSLVDDLANDCIVILSSHIVSDIVSIADEVAIIQNGELLVKGTQDFITDKVTGQVYEITMKKSELSGFKNNYLVVETLRKGDQLTVRYISDELIADSIISTPTLEDAYLFHTKNPTSTAI